MMSPSVGNRGFVVFRVIPFRMCGVSVGSGETGSRCVKDTSSSSWSVYVTVYVPLCGLSGITVMTPSQYVRSPCHHTSTLSWSV